MHAKTALVTALVAGGLALTAQAAGATYATTVRNETLLVTGDGASDSLVLRVRADAPDVLEGDVGDDGSSDFSVARDRFTRIRVRAGGGNDRVRIDASRLVFTDTPTTIDGQRGNDTLVGGAGAETLIGGRGADVVDGNGGDDIALLGAGADRFTWDPGDGSDVVEGQAGADAMAFNGSNVSESFDVSANGNRVRFLRNVAAVTMDLDDVERVDTLALGGADTVAVHDLTSTDLRDVGTDLAGARGSTAGDGQIDRMIVDATNGNDAMRVAGAGGTVDMTGLAASLRLTNAEPLDSLTVNRLGGSDTLDSSALAPGTIGLVFDQ